MARGFETNWIFKVCFVFVGAYKGEFNQETKHSDDTTGSIYSPCHCFAWDGSWVGGVDWVEPMWGHWSYWAAWLGNSEQMFWSSLRFSMVPPVQPAVQHQVKSIWVALDASCTYWLVKCRMVKPLWKPSKAAAADNDWNGCCSFLSNSTLLLPICIADWYEINLKEHSNIYQIILSPPEELLTARSSAGHQLGVAPDPQSAGCWCHPYPSVHFVLCFFVYGAKTSSIPQAETKQAQKEMFKNKAQDSLH